jgi:micrococcal nuclease
MKRFKFNRFITFVGILLLTTLACVSGGAGESSGLPTDVKLQKAEVVKVVDGDTIDVTISGKEYRLRYILVDTPETKKPGTPVQPYGPEASEANRKMVENQTVYLEKDVSENDRYGRLLRYVYLEDGRMVNEELLRLGMARVATFPPDVKYVDRFLVVQKQAQQAGTGLWQDN